MAPDEPSGARPGPVVLRIKLRYDDVEAMIQRFAVNVGKTGLFLPTKSLQPIGAEIKFELRLQTDQPVLVGLGRVKAAREPDPENPKATFGMAVELMRVTRESRDLILKMLERRRQLGLPDTGLPMPADIDAARRSDLVETGVSGVPQPVPALDSSPIAPSERTSEALMTSPRRQTGPIAVAKVTIAAPLEGRAVTIVAPLPPEPARRKRVPVAELIASASGPIATSTTTIDSLLDEQVDVGAALARARALAGSDLDGELEALRDSAAAPIEIGIEAASAELALQLGGAAVRRDRSARWAPPPPTASEPVAVPEPANEAKAEPVAVPEPAIEAKAEPVAPEPAATEIEAKVEAKIEPEPELAPEPVIAEPMAPEPAATEIDAHSEAGYIRDEPEDIRAPEGAETIFDGRDDEATPVAAPEVPTQDDDEAPLFERPGEHAFAPARAVFERPPSNQLIHDEADDSEFEEAHEVEPAQIHDEIHRLDEGDFEEVEHTQIGEPIDPAAYEEQAARLDAELDEAERDDLGFSATVDAGVAGYPLDTNLDPGHSSGGFALQEAQPGDYFMPLGEQPTAFEERSDSLENALHAAAHAEHMDEEEIEEIDDFEILAEADAEDEDLLASAAEQEVSAHHPHIGVDPHEAPTAEPQFELPPARPSFLNRLDIDEDSGYRMPAPEPQYDEFAHQPSELDPRILSAGHALRAFEDPDDHHDFNTAGAFTPVPANRYTPPVGEQSYTFAGDLPADDFDAPHGNYASPPSGGFVPPDAFDQSDVISIGPVPVEAARQAAEDFPDLESALEALDVDLDDLGGTGGRRRNARRGASSETMGSAPTEHAPSARGVRQTGGGRVVTPAPTPKSGRMHKRATTEDGILIDFDDEDQ